MKKWLFIFITSLVLGGCSTNLKDSSSEIKQSESADVQTENTQDSSDAKSNTVRQEELHEYHCDKFLLTVDGNQIDLTTINPELSSVSELYSIADEQLYLLGRIDENYNSLMIYDFTQEKVIFSEHGTTMCWVQGKSETVRYLKDNVVYDIDGNIIYQPEDGKLISMIEYVVDDFMVTVTDLNYENPEEIWIE